MKRKFMLSTLFLSLFATVNVANAVEENGWEIMNKKVTEIAQLEQHVSLKNGKGAYQDSRNVINTIGGVKDCSSEVIRVDTVEVDCDEGYGKMTQSSYVYGTDGYKEDCSTTSDGERSAWIVTDRSNCHALPLCQYETTATENAKCPDGKTGSITITYTVRSTKYGKHVSQSDCNASTTKTETSRIENCTASSTDSSDEEYCE